MIRFNAKKLRRLAAAVCWIFFVLNSESHAQSGRWFLCLHPQDPVHFFHDSQSSGCRNRIAVTAFAVLIGGVTVGSHVPISAASNLSERGHRLIYLPRGTSVLVLDATVDGGKLVYVWNTHTFVSMPLYYLPHDGIGKKSYSWQAFEERYEKGQFAITLQKTAFKFPTLVPETPADPATSLLPSHPAEIASGRIVEVHEIVSIGGKDMREVRQGKSAGYVAARDLRTVSWPALDIGLQYHVGSGLVQSHPLKHCNVSQSISSLKERIHASGLGGILTAEEIAELAAETGRTSRSNETRKTEIPANIKIDTFTLGADVGPTYFFRRERTDYNFTTISNCDSKRTQVVISQGNRKVIVPDGPIIILNDDDFSQYRARLLKAGFSSDEAFFIIARTSITTR